VRLCIHVIQHEILLSLVSLDREIGRGLLANGEESRPRAPKHVLASFKKQLQGPLCVHPDGSGLHA
jgi:hypothetical protein